MAYINVFLLFLYSVMITINTIAVCGAGTMGAGIAQVAATGGYQTVLFDLQQGVLDNAKKQIGRQLETAVAKGKLAADQAGVILDRIRFTADINDCVAELIIEAIVEKQEAKA